MQLCIALDMSSKNENLALLKVLQEFNLWVKIGLRSFIRDGKEFLKEIKAINPNFKIFLDLKLYDIPNTMATATSECIALGIDMLTIHASSGIEGMQAVSAVAKDSSLLVFAVTALTSFEDNTFVPIYNTPIALHTKTLALLAQEGGCNGVVCSAHESKEIKSCTSLLTLTPGIRFNDNLAQDQKRIATPKSAKEANADFIVVGRPIYQAQNPKSIVEKIYKEIQ
ncbi:orotidine-5'-phosphate decarboxylase [Helicobacter cholecystus]|uniref:orotidine-5'-phosphate decarboxylase n=1 Tax=Helicobacter cholecystus TaxID=45498 RepID=UPI002738F3A0|nr:orotidine-5'-phosphate decarboxylase [Helicobacter cholecystus]